MTSRSLTPISTRPPLKPGTCIEHNGTQATVVEDEGGAQLLVRQGGGVHRWSWAFRGKECSVLMEPKGEVIYESVEGYFADFEPTAELRSCLAQPGQGCLGIALSRALPGQGPQQGVLPGGYLLWEGRREGAGYLLQVRGISGSALMRRVPSESSAKALVRELKKNLPLALTEYQQLGFAAH